MRLDRLTNKFQLALADAQSLALGHDNQFIEPLHLMSALLNQEGGSVRPLLSAAGADVAGLRTSIEQAINRLPQVEGTDGDVQPSADLIRVLNLCDKLAQKRGDNFISSELFVLAALDSRGSLADLLKSAGATPEKLSAAIEQIRGGDSVNDQGAEDQRQALKKYTIDLTERAELGKLDPVIGRDEEIRRTIQVLQRRATSVTLCANEKARQASSRLVRSPSGNSPMSASVPFSTTVDSPVRIASSTRRLCASITRRSAGMRSPARITTTSPGTNAVVGSVS